MTAGAAEASGGCAKPVGPGTMPTVLLVDDDAMTRTLLAGLLGKEGFACLEAADGPAGVVLAVERTPAVIVLDVELPGMDGFTVARMLKADPRSAAIPILFLSSRSGAAIHMTARAVGGERFMQKPFDGRELTSSIRAALSRSEFPDRF